MEGAVEVVMLRIIMPWTCNVVLKETSKLSKGDRMLYTRLVCKGGAVTMLLRIWLLGFGRRSAWYSTASTKVGTKRVLLIPKLYCFDRRAGSLVLLRTGQGSGSRTKARPHGVVLTVAAILLYSGLVAALKNYSMLRLASSTACVEKKESCCCGRLWLGDGKRGNTTRLGVVVSTDALSSAVKIVTDVSYE